MPKVALIKFLLIKFIQLLFITIIIRKRYLNKVHSSLIMIFDCDTWEYIRQATLVNFTIVNISVVEEQKLLIMTIKEDESLYVMDYTSCQGIAKLGSIPNSKIQ